jgi:CubicO group peptidase (beta-lactamase class C family)
MGHADVEKPASARRVTKFRVHSLSKTLTASALMRLHEEGRIRLEAPVQLYVSSFPDKGHAITALHLASHRSGIRAYRDDSEAIETRHCETAGDALAAFRDDPLVFAPGSDSVYSNFGYQLLGAQMEQATSKPFPSLMREHVFEPLGMTDTVELRPGLSHPKRASHMTSSPPTPPMGDESGHRQSTSRVVGRTEDSSRRPTIWFGSPQLTLCPAARFSVLELGSRAMARTVLAHHKH